MTDYSKLKNAELESLLKERGLPHSGKKADLIARLTDHDKSSGASTTSTTNNPAPTTTSSTSAPAPKASGAADDEIDWEEENGNTANPTSDKTVAEPTKPVASSEPEAPLAGAGKGRAKNPLAVPNQVAAIDPSTTNDLTVASDPSTATAPPEAPATSDTSAPTAPTTTTEEPEGKSVAPPVDFSSHIPATSVDDELAKRKARAARFGITTTETAEESTKALERAKRFGVETPADTTGENKLGVSKLDEALPEKREKRKRGGASAEEAKPVDPLEDEGLKRRRGAGGAASGSGKGSDKRAVGSEKKANGAPSTTAAPAANGTAKPKEKIQGGAPNWMSEADRAKAEARKAKFATPAKS